MADGCNQPAKLIYMLQRYKILHKILGGGGTSNLRNGSLYSFSAGILFCVIVGGAEVQSPRFEFREAKLVATLISR
jgi:hypothetical protein